MKKLFFVLLFSLITQAEHGQRVRMQPIFTDMCQEGVTLFNLVAQKTNGALVVRTECGPGAHGPSGRFFPNTLLGHISINTERNMIPFHTIYTQNCTSAITFYQLVSQKTGGRVVFNVRCGDGGVAPSGRYFPNTVSGFVRLNLNHRR